MLAQEARVIKARYYLTVVAEIELEIPEGGDEKRIVQESFEGIPMQKFHVEHAEAEVEDGDTHEKRHVELN